MRDPEARTRHFIIKKKKEEEIFDEPSERRASGYQRERVSPERMRAKEEEKENLKAGFFARYDKGRSDDEKLRNRSPESFDEQYDEEEFEEDMEEEGRKAPLLVRIFSWIALLAIFFVCGYLGANYFFNWADKKGGPRVGDVVGSGTEAREISTASNVSGAPGTVKYDLFIPEGTSFTEREIEIKKGMTEEDIEKVASVYIDGLKETKMLDNNVRVLNVFRSGDWLYLDMTGAFSSSLKTLGREKSSQVITGLVRTMRDNFPPVRKVKFYIDGKESGEKTPADLTKAWEIN